MMTFLSIVKTLLVEDATEVTLPAWVPHPTKATTLGGILEIALKIVLALVVIASVIYLMLNGLKLVTSQGDSSKAAEAQKGITYAMIGIVVALAASVLVNFVLKKIGTPIEEIPGTTK